MKGTCKRILVLALGLALSVTSVAAGNTESSAKVKLSKTKYTLRIGKTLKLKVKGTKKKIKWISSKKKVATVSQKGVVKAKKAGKTTITAKIGKKKLRCKITVTKKADSGKSDNKSNNDNNNKNTDANKSNAELAKSLSVKAEQAADGSVLFSIKNNNNITINYASLTAKWKDVNGNEKSKILNVYFLPAGKTCYLAAKHSTQRDSNYVESYIKQNMSTMTYSTITVNKNYKETKDMTSTAGIAAPTLGVTNHYAYVMIENKSTITYDYLDMTMAMYNAAGQLMSVETQDFTQDEDPYLSAKGKAGFVYDFPFDDVKKEYWNISSYKTLYVMLRSKVK
ncbi:MAG: Ig-like domain-containing protein [Lachnospiraceae bacterium]|nr:Ig-like domain-containing protein [Lachnospiraceae bacterium]